MSTKRRKIVEDDFKILSFLTYHLTEIPGRIIFDLLSDPEHYLSIIKFQNEEVKYEFDIFEGYLNELPSFDELSIFNDFEHKFSITGVTEEMLQAFKALVYNGVKIPPHLDQHVFFYQNVEDEVQVLLLSKVADFANSSWCQEMVEYNFMERSFSSKFIENIMWRLVKLELHQPIIEMYGNDVHICYRLNSLGKKVCHWIKQGTKS